MLMLILAGGSAMCIQGEGLSGLPRIHLTVEECEFFLLPFGGYDVGYS